MPDARLDWVAPDAPSIGSYGRAGEAGIYLRNVAETTLVSVQERRRGAASLRELVRLKYGVELPDRPFLAHGQTITFLWTGPRQWFAIAKQTEPLGLFNALQHELGEAASLSDQSDARSIVRLSGPQARATLAKLVPIDLHPSAFRPRQTALTLFGHIPGQITLRDALPTYELMVFRSFAGSFWGSLLEAGAEFGISVLAADTLDIAPAVV